MISSSVRPIPAAEIHQLELQGCRCRDWSSISVADGFDPGCVRNVHFSGRVSLGVFSKQISLPGGRSPQTGVYDATIHNCHIHDNVYISRVHTVIANYIIERDVVIENVDSLVVDGESTFGNGVRVAVLHEAGGRAVPIFDSLSPQLAYIFAIERHRPKLIAALEDMVKKHAAGLKSRMGRIARGARIFNCGSLQNVRIGEAAELDGVGTLCNGSIVSDKSAPTRVGGAVMASDFIFAPGASVDSGAIIDTCYIGPGCTIGKHFSAKDCLFFGAAEAMHGEAASVFAGPLTVTDHKSTLLIAGMFSFFNAGSGTNQSNHMYKLGPVHQGVLERGCKTASDAYLLWPARVGPFTTIIGRHYQHVDASDFPFSLLIAEGKTTTLIPAIILHNIGVWRDEIKWQERLKECNDDAGRRALIKLLSPLVIERMQNGLKKLYDLRQTAGDDHVHVGQFFIKGYAIQRAIEIYNAATLLFLQNVLVNRFANAASMSLTAFHSMMSADAGHKSDAWIDAAGMIAPFEALDEILSDIERGRLASLQEIETGFDAIYSNYNDYEWAFAQSVLEKRIGKKAHDILPADMAAILEAALEASANLKEHLLVDAAKEFDKNSRISFGLSEEGDEDFFRVRGSLETNAYIQKILGNLAAQRQRTNQLIAGFKKLCA